MDILSLYVFIIMKRMNEEFLVQIKYNKRLLYFI